MPELFNATALRWPRMKVIGLDACKAGWVAVTLSRGAFLSARVIEDLVNFLEQHGDIAQVGIDIPIGFPESGLRNADVAARKFVGLRRNSVFMTPPRVALECQSHSEAIKMCKSMTRLGMSAQAYGLRHRIFEVDSIVRRFPAVFEVHPEVSFRAMNGKDLAYSKKSWNGQVLRTELLSRSGIDFPQGLVIDGHAGADDVLDAAAAAWTAHRKALTTALTLPADPESFHEGRPVAIWY